MKGCELDNWKEALAALLTYAHPEDFARLCGKLLPTVETQDGHAASCLPSRQTVPFQEYLLYLLNNNYLCIQPLILASPLASALFNCEILLGRYPGRSIGA